MTTTDTTTTADTGSGPASATERLFWFLERIAPGAGAARAVGRIRLDGPLDRAALTAALHAVHHRHEGLRTAFVTDGPEVRRQVRPAVPVEPLWLAEGTGFDAAVTALLTPDAFDIAAGRLHRVAIAPDPRGATLYLAAHHIVVDGLAYEIFTADLARAYRRASTGQPAGLPVRPRPDPVELPAPQRAELVEQWRAALDGVADLPDLGVELSQRDVARADLAQHTVTCPPAVWDAVRAQARGQACSPFAVLLTGYGRAITAITGARDFCVGTAVALRTAEQADELSCLVNTVPIRLRDLEEPDAIGRVRDTLIEAMIAAELPSEEIVRAARGAARTRRMPLYQALLALQSWQRIRHDAGRVRMWTVPVRPVGASAELQTQAHETAEGGLRLVAQAPVHGPWAQRLEELLAQFTRLLEGAG